MKANDIISRHVISISSESSVLQAAHMLMQYRVSGLPVIDAAGDLIGVMTDADTLSHAEKATRKQSPRWLGIVLRPGKLAEDYTDLLRRNVREVMSEKFNSIPEDTSFDEIERFIKRLHIKWLPVVRGRKLVGIVNRHGIDLAKLLLSRMAALHLDEKVVVESKPDQMRELQRLCSTCASQKRCKRDLANDPVNPVWQQYCHNAATFVALQGQRAIEMIVALGKALEAARI
jgi:CBS-domain-containing membrane protein